MYNNFNSDDEDISLILEEIEALTQDTLGECIQKAREKKNISQKELAKLADISAAQLSRIESDKTGVSSAYLKRISGCIGVPYADLLFKAGYSDISGDRPLYNKTGDIIDTINISESIYKADVELLECLSNIDQYATSSDINALKAFIKGIKKMGKLRNNHKPTDKEKEYINIFNALTNFINVALSSLDETD